MNKILDNSYLEDLLSKKKISNKTYNKVYIAKKYIESKYSYQTLYNNELNSYLKDIDKITNISENSKIEMKKEIFHNELNKFRKTRKKFTIYDYESLSIIGRGAFGEVHVCKEKSTGKIVAIKKIKKDVLEMKNQILHIRNEQLLMKKLNSPWIVDLIASFQEGNFLYLIMEYCQGGDLMNLLIKKDIFTEEEARFYTAELILCIEAIHNINCIHRDIKPDNVLIDKTGHIKLSDFGLAKVNEKLFDKNYNENINNLEDKNNFSHKKNYSCVGTAYYVAPEVLNKKGYGPEIDWWSVGIIFYEMLIGYAPFCSKETSEVCYKVLNWKNYLKIPKKNKISKEAEDLIFKLVNEPKKRLGINGVNEIKNHPFFKGIDWKNIRNTKAPFIPNIKNEYDTKYFDTFDEIMPFYPEKYTIRNKRKDVEYLGYTYKKEDEQELNLKEEYEHIVEKFKKCKSQKNLNDNNNNNNNNNQNSTKNLKLRVSNSNDVIVKNSSSKKKENVNLITLINRNNTNNKNILNSKYESNNTLGNNINNTNNTNNNNNNISQNNKLQIINLPKKKIEIDCGPQNNLIKNNSNKFKNIFINTTNNNINVNNITTTGNNRSFYNNNLKNNIFKNNNKIIITSVDKPVKFSPSPNKKLILKNLIKNSLTMKNNKIKSPRGNKKKTFNKFFKNNIIIDDNEKNN